MEHNILSSQQLLEHWQGHRRLTRRVIEAFPEDQLFTFSVGGMRPFAELAVEMLLMGVPGIKGVLTGKWKQLVEDNQTQKKEPPRTKDALLQRWDEATAEMDALWPQIPAQRFQETDVAFEMYEGQVYWFILYWIDNEIHHRGQGYVYLRALGIEPPPFWER
ncbi:DinB family protein [Chitinophaga cymbidii]|uniref:DNA damage-inducible protein DinB n=1 Tax=Chitinophaga cymbidii TaxID=1096750 RepID=A0A512RFH4_9BACT|nr:DinB family protein [Chitinophaga cymbidii]GEP94467.1 DNA damage-inducible protein DinB [Chitinophaga cymbidii]